MTEQTIMLKAIPQADRPRERLLSVGAEHLSNQELLAIILRTGSKELSVVQLAEQILSRFEGLEMLKEATIEELIEVKGIGKTKAVQLLAAMEIGRRMGSFKKAEAHVIRSPKDGADYVMESMRNLVQEHFVCLYLNTKNKVLHQKTVFIGSLNASIVHPREVFREALRRSAASIICFHNHPSGDPTPSREDIEVTRRLLDCGVMLGIEVLDHIIIGDQKFVSLKEKGVV